MIKTSPQTQVSNPNHVVKVLYRSWLGLILRSPSNAGGVDVTRQLFPWWPVLVSTKPPPDFSLGNISNFCRNSANFALECKEIFCLPKPAAYIWNFQPLKELWSDPSKPNKRTHVSKFLWVERTHHVAFVSTVNVLGDEKLIWEWQEISCLSWMAFKDASTRFDSSYSTKLRHGSQ